MLKCDIGWYRLVFGECLSSFIPFIPSTVGKVFWKKEFVCMYLCLCPVKRTVPKNTSDFHSRGWSESGTDERYLLSMNISFPMVIKLIDMIRHVPRPRISVSAGLASRSVSHLGQSRSRSVSVSLSLGHGQSWSRLVSISVDLHLGLGQPRLPSLLEWFV